MTNAARVTLVNDGQIRWYANEQTLLDAMRAQGWDRVHSFSVQLWAEPEASDPQNPEARYCELCDAVPELEAQPWHSTLRFEPSQDCWVFDPRNAGQPDADE